MFRKGERKILTAFDRDDTGQDGHFLVLARRTSRGGIRALLRGIQIRTGGSEASRKGMDAARVGPDGVRANDRLHHLSVRARVTITVSVFGEV